jgi:hypothetical protein
MAVNYTNTIKDARMQVVIDAIDADTDPGVLVIGTSALSGATGVLATIELSATSATTSSGVLTFADLPKEDDASATGTAALAELRDGAGTVIVSGLTVGVAATDIIITTTSISENQPVRVTAATITHG